MFKRFGSRFWYTRIGGVPVSLRTEVAADAEALEGKLKQQHWQETYLGVKPRKSWEQACVQWGKEAGGKITWKDDVRAVNFWTRFFGGLKDLREINRERVDEICQQAFEITKEASPQNNTANHYIAYLSAILRAASRKWDWIERSPLLRRYPAPDGRKRWLSVGEWRGLERSLPWGLRLPAKFALATGLRRGTLVALQWGQIVVSSRSMAFPGTSNKLGNTIPLNDTAMGVLEEIQASPVRHMQLVFTKDGKKLGHYQKEWYRALDKCGLRGVEGQEDFCWHGLRHTWASWLAQAGVPEWARKRLGGWSSREMVDRYSHLDLEALRPYAAVIDTLLSQSTDKQKATG